MRADRLVAALLVLQARGQVTASEMADELEVSVKTARRDLEALAMAGIPVYSQPGRNGGWQLIGGARTDLSGLTAAEATTLFMVAGPASTATPEAKQALRKLVQALPETFRAEAQAAADSTMLDPTSWGGRVVDAPPFLDVLRQAVVDARQIRLGYGDRQGNETTRVAHPLGVVKKGPTWYLVADTERGMRTFKVWRVRSVDVLEGRVERPKGFDLAAHWRSIVDEVEERRIGVRAHLRVPTWAVTSLRGAFGHAVRVHEGTETEPDPADGNVAWVEVTVGATSVESLARQLVPWAPMFDVLDPVDLRIQLVEIAQAIAARHS